MRFHFLPLWLLIAAAPSVGLAGQAVERADVPRRGALRVTFDPRTMVWQQKFTPEGRRPIGAALSGDSAATVLPSAAFMQNKVRALTGIMGYVANIGRELLAIRAERRVMPISLEYGLTGRLTLGITVPIVRVMVREGFQVHPPGANVGLVPRLPADSARYRTFFAHFDAALTQLGDSIAAGAYGCPSSPACSRAQAVLAQGQTLRQALDSTVHGTADTVAQFLPLASSDAGRQIAALVTSLERALADTFNVTPFAQDTFLLPTSSGVTASDAARLLAARTNGLDLAPYSGTPRRLRFFSGDIEVSAKYRLLARDAYAATGQLVVRLPTGHLDSPNDPFDLATGDHQTDLEGRVTGELTLWHRLWLNGSVRAARQLPGQRERRIGPVDQPFLPPTSLARLRWDPGDYVSADVAPMYRFSRSFAVGVTAAYYTQARDRYAFTSAQDSTRLATQLGGPVDVSVLDAGTAIRQTRLGVAMTYVGPRLEAGFSVEQTVSGAGGPVPAATVFRIVLRQTILLF